jgi:hypothetical protein
MRKSPYQLSPPPLHRWLRCLALVLLSLVMSSSALAQESAVVEGAEANIELLIRAEADIQELQKRSLRESDLAHRAERTLKSILQRDPSSPLRFQVLEDLKPVQEILGRHSLLVAEFYMGRGHGHSLKGAESRLLQIARGYPSFSRMDKVLSLLGSIALREERPDEVARYLGALVCSYPSSEYYASSFSQLSALDMPKWEGCGNFKLWPRTRLKHL